MKKLATLVAIALLVVACQRPAGGSETPADTVTPSAVPADGLY
ncbi:MAG TPA: hypothetical protein VFQ81_09610 [Candidatus Limnocylindria bacterium]|nr:hypothetical protein [Candidatus Limnocylindria bacterium]